MGKEKDYAAGGNAGNKAKIAVELDLPTDGELITCDICGHANQKNAGMCEMCSNYLFTKGGNK